MRSADVVIVGGGIVGSAVAYFLSSGGAFSGRRIVLIERDPSYAQASTSRSVGGLRQQFSTPENIAMSQFTLSLIREIKTLFGSDADVGFREQGYLIMATARIARSWRRTLRSSSPMAPTWCSWSPPSWRAGFPGLRRRASPPPASAGPARAGLILRAWRPCSAMPPRREASAVLHDRVTAIESAAASRRFGWQAAPGSLAAPRQCGGTLGRGGRGDGGRAAAGRAAQALRLRHRLPRGSEALHKAPLTVDPSGVWFRPEGRFFLCGKSPEESEEPPAADLDAIDHAFFESEVWPRLAMRVPAFESVKAVNAWAGHYDYNTLDQNAVIGPHPGSATSTSPMDSPGMARSRARRPGVQSRS